MKKKKWRNGYFASGFSVIRGCMYLILGQEKLGGSATAAAVVLVVLLIRVIFAATAAAGTKLLRKQLLLCKEPFVSGFILCLIRHRLCI